MTADRTTVEQAEDIEGLEEIEPLGTRVSSALRWSFANSAFTRLASVGVSVFLARLIAPEQFGVFAAALVVINIVLSISELGVSVALVRHEGGIAEMAPTVATLSIASSAALAGFCLVGAPYFAVALGAPEATGVIRLMSLAIFVAGFSAVPGAILQREFRQDHKMAADFASFVTSTTVVVVLALAGWGPWALAWSRVVANVTAAICMIWLTKERYWPGFDRKQAREVLAFGLPLAGSSLLIFGVMNVDYIVVGTLLGKVELGLYLIAFNLSSWPVGAFSSTIRSVSTAAFSKLRHDPVRFQDSFGQALGILMALAVPACALLAGLAIPLVRFAYGDRWAGAAAALSLLAALGSVRVALELAYDFLAAAGRPRSILVIHVVWLVTLVPVLVIGAHLDGIRGVSLGHVVVVLFVVTPIYLNALSHVGVKRRGIARALFRPALGGAAIVAVGLATQQVLGSDFWQLAVGGTLSLLAYVAIMWPMRHDLRHPGASVTG